MDLQKEIGRKLKELRLQHDYSVREVAEKIGVHYTYVSKIEKGQNPSIDKLQKLCELYNVPVSSLFGEEQEVPDELKALDVKWITFNKEMIKEGLTPEKIKELVEVVKKLNKME
jgi:HTH-type transcriptional regulator, competence development regulator